MPRSQARLDLALVPVTIAGRHFAASSRVMKSGAIVIELDVASAGLTPRIVTGESLRAGPAQARARGRCAR